MDILLFTLAAICMVLGILGSFLPVLPGVPLSWVGLLLLYLAPSVPINYWVLGIAFVLAAIIYALQLIIPAMGTKKYGGSKAGMWGATIGLVIGIFVPVPLGIIIGAFAGAFIGEIINKSDSKSALRAAYGSFIGLLASTFMELVVAVGFLIFFSYKAWELRDLIF
ncbi:hypothetical protein APR41_11800 [Salegentibacter salinarum]|uniref:DUF456 domain-containing protein n=1 Tax=Salegentibacter salinarum TaxID=447422 RepID=A0A2N0U256_9FLAO|nr:DUF456 domain-containing protein [Salegentibacter salinarum]PKD21093.1 hypothetical protein APR41_11800 [Salegentibacter salinarum]SKB75807.1 hypothetical protein SAMN05660903_02406 [Salegentibacter salinarum]